MWRSKKHVKYLRKWFNAARIELKVATAAREWLVLSGCRKGAMTRALMADYQALVRQPDSEGFGESAHFATID